MDLLTRIQVFSSVVNKGSFVAAAESLGMSRPMASKHLARLEEDLGVRLLNRTTRRLNLTEEGQAFYSRCQGILEQIDEAVREAGEKQAAPRGRLKVNAPLSFGHLHLARAVAEYQMKYPDVSVDLHLNDRRIELMEDGYDLAVRVGRLSDSSLIARKLSESHMLLCAAPSYIEKHGAPTSPRDLMDHACLRYTYFDDGDNWNFTKNGESISVQVKGKLDCNNGDALVEAAIAGGGVVLQPCFLIGEYLNEGRLVHLLPDYETTDIPIHAVYPQNRLVPQKLRTFVDFLVEWFRPKPWMNG